MKNTAICLIAMICPLLAQGPLTPPGVPAPTMKSLDQVEPRTPIPRSAAVPVAGPHATISEPGSYYLTGPVTVSEGDGIRITSPNVVLDLKGFSIATLGDGGNAISVLADNCIIRNGTIQSNGQISQGSFVDSGFENGVFVLGACAISQMQILGCRSAISSIGGSVTDCVVKNCQYGIESGSVSRSQVTGAGVFGIAAKDVVDCSSSAESLGIQAERVRGCLGQATSISGEAIGIQCQSASESEGRGATIGIDAAFLVKSCVGISVRSVQTPPNKLYGIRCANAENSSGLSYGFGYSYGIQASGSVSNCKGTASMVVQSNLVSGAIGVECENASNTSGSGSGGGLRCFSSASNSYGKAADLLASGIKVDGTASNCRGDHNLAYGVAIEAGIAVACTRAQGAVMSSNKYLGTP